LVESSKIDRVSQKISLDTAVKNAELQLENAHNEYESSQKTLAKSLEQVKLQLDASKNVNEDTTINLQIEKIKNSVNKSKLDLHNLELSNMEQKKSF
jgi:cysteine sulfinate desulfinase/cysteine desulfurase-like protein